MNTEPGEPTAKVEPTEPEWVRHAIWWRLYPLGFAGIYPAPPGGTPGPGEHRLRRIITWLDHAVALGASGIALGPIFTAATTPSITSRSTRAWAMSTTSTH